MYRLSSYIKDIEDLLTFKEYEQLTKKLIDLALDTEDVKHYQDMLNHLDWLDHMPNPDIDELNGRYEALFLSLKNALQYKHLIPYEERKALIKIENLQKVYFKGGFTLGPINLVLEENQMLGLVGENGNGKTTLLRILAKELNPTFGHIKYDFDYSDQYDLRSRLVYIPQRTPAWHGLLLDNLRFTAAMHGVKGKENELKVDLIIARMGIRKYRNFAWAGLSSGYKMRFELARALLRNPKVMLIDEPLANLDIIAQKNVLDDLKGIAASPFRSMGIILSSQQLYEVEKNADDVLFLKEGSQKNRLNKVDASSGENQVSDANTPILEPYMLEFETTWEIAKVREVLKPLGYQNLQLNGGTYIISLPHGMVYDIFLHHVLKEGMPLTYFRDISKSTRRFFLS